VRNFASNEANQLLHGGQTGTKTQSTGGGFMGEAKNLVSNEAGQLLHGSGGHGVQPPSGTQRVVQGATQGATHGTQQQSGGGIGQQASNFISKEAGGFFH